jgi:hypothetical protein
MNPAQPLNWRYTINSCFLVVVFVVAAWVQEPAKAQASPELQHILNQMDQIAANFRAAHAEFVWINIRK